MNTPDPRRRYNHFHRFDGATNNTILKAYTKGTDFPTALSYQAIIERKERKEREEAEIRACDVSNVEIVHLDPFRMPRPVEGMAVYEVQAITHSKDSEDGYIAISIGIFANGECGYGIYNGDGVTMFRRGTKPPPPPQMPIGHKFSGWRGNAQLVQDDNLPKSFFRTHVWQRHRQVPRLRQDPGSLLGGGGGLVRGFPRRQGRAVQEGEDRRRPRLRLGLRLLR